MHVTHNAPPRESANVSVFNNQVLIFQSRSNNWIVNILYFEYKADYYNNYLF